MFESHQKEENQKAKTNVTHGSFFGGFDEPGVSNQP